jgi:hypothetical protein
MDFVGEKGPEEKMPKKESSGGGEEDLLHCSDEGGSTTRGIHGPCAGNYDLTSRDQLGYQ